MAISMTFEWEKKILSHCIRFSSKFRWRIFPKGNIFLPPYRIFLCLNPHIQDFRKRGQHNMYICVRLCVIRKDILRYTHYAKAHFYKNNAKPNIVTKNCTILPIFWFVLAWILQFFCDNRRLYVILIKNEL